MSDPETELTASASVVINAPAASIFNLLADPRRHAEIDGSNTVQSVVEGPERLGLGSVFAVKMKRGIGYTTRNTVHEFEADRLIAWGNRGAHRWRYELEPAGEDGHSTRVTETWDGTRYTGLGRLIFRLTGLASTQRSIEQTLSRLRTVVEQS